MEFVKRSWRQIRHQFEQMSANVLLLIGSLIVISIMAILLLLVYAGSADLVAITAFAPERQGEAVAKLQSHGIDVQRANGQVLVRVDQRDEALSVLQASSLLASDTSAAFEQLIRDNNVWMSDKQFQEKKLLSIQKVLGKVIAKQKNVRSAFVIISKPDRRGFGVSYVKPSASVSVVMQGGHRVTQNMVEGIAGLVSGALAELRPKDVIVVDANNGGGQLTVRSEDEVGPDEALNNIRKHEVYYRDKLVESLRFIRNVIVTVSVQTEQFAARNEQQTAYEKSEPLTSTRAITEESENASKAGQPGVSANTGQTIRTSQGTGSTQSREVEEKDYGVAKVTKQVTTKFTSQPLTKINASIAVPHSYFVSLSKNAAKPAGDDSADSADANEPDQAMISQEIDRIKDLVLPHIEVRNAKGEIKVAYYDDRPITAHTAGLVMSPSGVTGMLGSNWVQTASLGVLVVTAMALMLSMVRKANQAPALPSAEDLAGVPPTLPGDDDLIGEAEESETAMAGMEIAEEDIRSRKIADQINELVKANPEEAAQLMNKWVGDDE